MGDEEARIDDVLEAYQDSSYAHEQIEEKLDELRDQMKRINQKIDAIIQTSGREEEIQEAIINKQVKKDLD